MAANRIDLTTVQRVKDWLDSPSMKTAEQAVVQQVITAASAYWLQACGFSTGGSSLFTEVLDFDELYDGPGGDRLFLRNRPVQSVTALTINSVAIAASAAPNSRGYVIDSARKSVSLRGITFRQGIQNVHAEYAAGYAPLAITARTSIPVTPGPYTVQITDPWLEDSGVTFFSSGDPLTKADHAPAAGEYYQQEPGLYLFNAADQGKSIVIAYNAPGTPYDVGIAATQMVAVNVKRRGWIDQSSQAMAQGAGTISFRDWELPKEVQRVIDFYSRTAVV